MTDDTCTPLQLSIVAHARRYSGQMLETRGRNSGPEVDAWLDAVGQLPGASWCAAFVWWAVRSAAAEVGVEPLRFRKSASALRLVQLNAALLVPVPTGGDLVVFDHGGGLGHVGIVTEVVVVGNVIAAIRHVSGNTSATGSRDAEFVWERRVDVPGPHPIAGFLRVA